MKQIKYTPQERAKAFKRFRFVTMLVICFFIGMFIASRQTISNQRKVIAEYQNYVKELEQGRESISGLTTSKKEIRVDNGLLFLSVVEQVRPDGSTGYFVTVAPQNGGTVKQAGEPDFLDIVRLELSAPPRL